MEDVAREAGVECVPRAGGRGERRACDARDGAVIGGEGNGGVILPELHLGRDAPVGAALVLQLLLEEGRPLSAIVADLPRYVIVKDKLDRPDAPLDAVYEALRGAFRDAGGGHARTGCGWRGRTGGCTCGRQRHGADRARDRRGADRGEARSSSSSRGSRWTRW